MARSSSENLLIHALGDEWRWVQLDAQGRRMQSGRCSPDAPDWPGDRPQTVLVDAGRCMGLSVELPDMPANRMAQALRWAAEEHLAGSAEDEHVVAGPRDEFGRVNCVVVSHPTMEALCAPFAGQPAERMVPDALCLPWQEGALSLAECEGRILARWGEWQFGSFESELAEDILAGVAPAEARIGWYGGHRPDWLDTQHAPDAAGNQSLDQYLAEGAARAGINLLGGPYSPRSAMTARTYWRWSVGLAAGLVALAIASIAIENYQLTREANALQERLDDRFAELFPGVTARGRHRELAERELARLRFGQAAGLLDLMSRTAPVIEGQDRLVLDGLNYRDGVLELTLRAPDVAALDQLEQRLRALDLAADVQSASLDEDGASGRIRVSGGGR
jgi:general secretion pathway protein L